MLALVVDSAEAGLETVAAAVDAVAAAVAAEEMEGVGDAECASAGCLSGRGSVAEDPAAAISDLVKGQAVLMAQIPSLVGRSPQLSDQLWLKLAVVSRVVAAEA